MRISGGNMIQNVKNFSLVLFCCLFLSLCTACTRALTGNIETPSPMPTQPEATIPSNSPEATLHEWSGDGFSYTSKNLGITVEFPPEWENLMTISDDITYEYFVEGQSMGRYLSLISIGAPQMIMDLKLIMENASLW